MKQALTIVMCTMLLLWCNACGSPPARTTPVSTALIQPPPDITDMRFPVADVNAIHINEAFSTDASAPWGFAHNGIDFMTEQASEKIYATTSGTVTRVELNHFPPKNNWQVNIAIAVNDRYTLGYAIEPMTNDQAVGDAQMKSISVSVGQVLHTGDVLGELIGGVDGAHIHWGVNDNTTSQAICPAPFFTADQQKLLVARIPRGASKLCYP